jgi:TolB protein
MQRKIFILLLTLLASFIVCGAASAATVKNNHITKVKDTVGLPAVYQSNPAMDGIRLVWEESDNGGQASIYVKNLQTGVRGRLQSSPNDQVSADISGTRVVWVELDPTGDFNTLYVKNIATGITGRITSPGNYPESPAISGTRVVWQNGGIVYVKNLATGVSGRILTSSQSQYGPNIDGTRVVWVQRISTYHHTIYVKNLATGGYGIVLTSDQDQDYPNISGTRVVWQQRVSVDRIAIMVKNLATGGNGILSTSTKTQEEPNISGIQVVGTVICNLILLGCLHEKPFKWVNNIIIYHQIRASSSMYF